MKNKRLTFVVSLLAIYLIGAFFVNQKVTNSKKETVTVGVLQFVSHPALDEIYKGVEEGLKENGYDKGKNLEIIFQNGQADQSKLAIMSQQLVQKKADVLIGIATPAAQALANTTQEIPIILGAITDPVSAGLVKENQKPGGNITGVSDQSPLSAQMDLLKELVPAAKKIGILYASSEENSRYQVAEAQKAAEAKGLTVKTYAVPSSNEIAQTVQVMTKETDVIYIPTDNTIANAMQTVVGEANRTKTPIIPSVDTMVEQGGLATVGINQHALGVQAGKMAAEVLSGKSQPATTPIYTFNTGDAIINEKQAQKLGITIPAELAKKSKLIN